MIDDDETAIVLERCDSSAATDGLDQGSAAAHGLELRFVCRRCRGKGWRTVLEEYAISVPELQRLMGSEHRLVGDKFMSAGVETYFKRVMRLQNGQLLVVVF